MDKPRYLADPQSRFFDPQFEAWFNGLSRDEFSALLDKLTSERVGIKAYYDACIKIIEK